MPNLSDGEKLIAMMLADIMRVNEISGEVDPELVQKAISSGNLWMLDWDMQGVFHGEDTNPAVAEEVAALLSMCSFIEFSLQQLSPEDRATVEHPADEVFVGFDGNNETDQFSAASAMIEYLGRFDEFSGRSLNSHAPMLEQYRRMKEVYDGIGGPTTGGLSASDLRGVLSA